MKKFILIFVFFCAFVPTLFAQVNIGDLIREDDKWLNKDKKPYSGDFVEYYPDGKIKGKGTLKNGVVNGYRVTYFENGSKSMERTYVDGVANGESKEYFENGKLNKQAILKNGETDGKALVYYDSGIKHVELNFDNGTQVGDYLEYNEQGILIKQCEFVDGKVSYGKKVTALYDEALKDVSNGKYERAIVLYDEAIHINPTIPDVYFSRGAAKGMMLNMDGAILDYNKAIELKPDYAQAYANRGVAKINQYTTKGIINPTATQCESACEDFYKAKDLGAGAQVEDMIYVHCERNNIKQDSSHIDKVPLFIVDGNILEYSAIKKLDPNNVLEVEVLKDKNATDKYGKQGINGVALITTIKFGVRAYQKLFSQISEDYKSAISKNDDSGFKYIIDGKLLEGEKRDIVSKLYTLKAENIQSVKCDTSKAQVTITTKK